MVTPMTIAAIRKRMDNGQSVNAISKALKVAPQTVKKYGIVLKVKETPTNRVCIKATCPSPEDLAIDLTRIFVEGKFSSAQKAELLSKLYRTVDTFKESEEEKTDEEFPPDEN